jgi:hypothetical protein
MTDIADNLSALKTRIQKAAYAAGRGLESIQLLAVSKTFGVEKILACQAAGQLAFGENYVQEALLKIQTLQDPRLQWHFLGPIQSNKTRLIAEHFDWVHSLEREKIAQRLNEARSPNAPTLNICIEVNMSGEASKSGVKPQDAFALADYISRLPRLHLRGLMCIPEPTQDTALRAQRFSELRQLQQALIARGHPLDTLSMGMSDDLEEAITEGSTLVRIGRALFGARPTHPNQ